MNGGEGKAEARIARWPDFTIRLQCPKCSRVQRGAYPTEAATEVYRRTCRKCRTRWQVIVTPLRGSLPGAKIHRVEWLALGAA